MTSVIASSVQLSAWHTSGRGVAATKLATRAALHLPRFDMGSQSAQRTT